jgi:hypothetical protein
MRHGDRTKTKSAAAPAPALVDLPSFLRQYPLAVIDSHYLAEFSNAVLVIVHEEIAPSHQTWRMLVERSSNSEDTSGSCRRNASSSP